MFCKLGERLVYTIEPVQPHANDIIAMILSLKLPKFIIASITFEHLV